MSFYFKVCKIGAKYIQLTIQIPHWLTDKPLLDLQDSQTLVESLKEAVSEMEIHIHSLWGDNK